MSLYSLYDVGGRRPKEKIYTITYDKGNIYFLQNKPVPFCKKSKKVIATYKYKWYNVPELAIL